MRTQAIIIKKIPIKEHDELIVCYTPGNGKQTYQAKSIRRHTSKQACHLDLLNLADFSLVAGNGHPIITGAHSETAFYDLKSNIKAMAVAYFLLECFDKLIFDGEEDPILWNFLNKKLHSLNELAKNPETKWAKEINLIRSELVSVMGHEPGIQLEELAGSHFRSLQFARKVLE